MSETTFMDTAPIQTDVIVCPECKKIQQASVVLVLPWPIFCEVCEGCQYQIMESEWQIAKTLSLNLKRKWYDLIESDVKKEEYRALTPYFMNKLLLCHGKVQPRAFWARVYYFNNKGMTESSVAELAGHLKIGPVTYQKFDTNTFQNGMSKTAPRFQIEHLGIEIKEGNPDWGAVKGVKYFAIQLGAVIGSNFKPCGEGENICNCKTSSECGYL